MYPKKIPTNEFLEKAMAHGVTEIELHVAFTIDNTNRVRTFVCLIGLPMKWPGRTSVCPRPKELEEVVGVDPACWFDDGYRLPSDDWEAISSCSQFAGTTSPKGRAIDSVREYIDLHNRITQNGIKIAGVNGLCINEIMQWAQITIQAAEDPEFKKKVDPILG